MPTERQKQRAERHRRVLSTSDVSGGRFRWDANANRYRDARGRFVAWRDVTAALEAGLDASVRRFELWARMVRNGSMSLAQFELQVAAEVRSIHLVSAAVARGGIPRLTADDLQRIEATVRRELGYLARLTSQVADGSQALDGTWIDRARQYALAGRETLYTERGMWLKGQGYDEERNIRYLGDTCAGCFEAEGAGWVPIGTLAPIGTRDCRRNCRCHIIYRKRATGQVWRAEV
jgi:hypothetical protein